MEKRSSIEETLAEVESYFTAIEEVHLSAVEEKIQEIRGACQAGLDLMDKVHEHLGLYSKPSK